MASSTAVSTIIRTKSTVQIRRVRRFPTFDVTTENALTELTSVMGNSIVPIIATKVSKLPVLQYYTVYNIILYYTVLQFVPFKIQAAFLSRDGV